MTDERRVWFVTGASTGLGHGLARAIVDHGDRLVATARDRSAVSDLIELAPDRVRAVRLDVTRPEQIATAVDEARWEFGRIDVAVNNAGYGLIGAFEDLDDVDLRDQLETNVFGALAVSRAVLPLMRRQRAGHLVQMSSVNGVVPGPGGSAYVMSKFALEGFSEALAAEVAHLGIRVTIVEPGAFRTDFNGRSLRWAASSDPYAGLVDPAREAFQAGYGTQPGDPYRAGQAIIAAVESADPPLRLPLGPDAFDDIRAYLEQRLEELAALEPVGAGTSFS